MIRRSIIFATVLLAGTSLSGSAQAGLFDWASGGSKSATATPAQKPAAGSTQTAGTATTPATAAASQGNLENDIHQAQAMRQAGNLNGAVRALAQMMLVAPDDPRVVGEYGKVLAQQGRSQEAVNFLMRATQLQGGDWTLYSALGVALDQTGDSTAARQAYEHALQLKPGEPSVLNNYALSRATAGDLAGAQRLIAQAEATPNADPKIARNATMLASMKPVAAIAGVAAARLPANAVVEKLPVDPKAGPVATAKADAHAATHAPRDLSAAKAKAAAKKKDTTPALRMTADASAP
jgi:Flp pilus assembly protein TadD